MRIAKGGAIAFGDYDTAQQVFPLFFFDTRQ
jgi:hypothetical protein